MRKYLRVFWIGIGLFLIFGVASADEDFGTDSPGGDDGGVVPEAVSVPEGEPLDEATLQQYQEALLQAQENQAGVPAADPGQVQVIDEALLQQYAEALERAQREAGSSSSLSDQVLEEANQLLDPSLPGGAEELPFELLQAADDLDRDGLENNEEVRLGTNVQSADTDGDGFIDGLEITRGYNPLLASPGDKVVYQEPLMEAASGSGDYQVTGVRLASAGDQEILAVSGIGPDLSLVALMVFSEPKVWIVRADASGRFLYTSADTLDVGEHTIYAAAVSADGIPDDVSEPFVFQRAVDGIIVSEPSPAPAAPASTSSFLAGGTLVVGLAAVAAVLALVVTGVFAYLLIWRRRKQTAGSS